MKEKKAFEMRMKKLEREEKRLEENRGAKLGGSVKEKIH